MNRAYCVRRVLSRGAVRPRSRTLSQFAIAAAIANRVLGTRASRRRTALRATRRAALCGFLS